MPGRDEHSSITALTALDAAAALGGGVGDDEADRVAHQRLARAGRRRGSARRRPRRAGADDACTSSLISELDAISEPQALGWAAVVQDTLREQLHKVVVRESATVLAIELPQLLVYRLDAAETVTTSLPASCLRSGAMLRLTLTQTQTQTLT